MRGGAATLVALGASACCLAACLPQKKGFVAPLPTTADERVEVGGQILEVRQEPDWPSLINPIDAETGEQAWVVRSHEPTVIVRGTPDRDLAIAALAKFCGKPIDPAGFDTQVTYYDPATQEHWFDQWKCR